MSSFNLYIFNDSESATLFSLPVLMNISADMEKIDTTQLKEIFSDMDDVHLDDNTKDILLTIDSWSYEKTAQAFWDVRTLIFNKAAIISDVHMEAIEKIGNALLENFGSDSSTYSACATFATVLKGLSLKIIDFPESDDDLFYRDME